MKSLPLKLRTVIFLLVLFQTAYCQIDPDLILQKKSNVSKVLLIGSWHFNYPGLDANKTDEKNKINIYSKQRQKELAELIEYIAKFNPTKIMVESGANTGYLKYNYKVKVPLSFLYQKPDFVLLNILPQETFSEHIYQ